MQLKNSCNKAERVVEMGQIEKLIERIKTIPVDLTYDELRRLMNYLGYQESNKGKTSGSRVAFCRKKDKAVIILHKPHPGNIVKKYAIRQLLETLKERGEL